MASNPKDFVLDPEKCGGLPLEEKRQLVREIAQCSNDAPEILSSFSRKELLQLICAEMGKERKYSGFTKLRMIEHLLMVISKSKKRKDTNNVLELSLAKSEVGVKKQRRPEDLVQMAAYQDHMHYGVKKLRKTENLVQMPAYQDHVHTGVEKQRKTRELVQMPVYLDHVQGVNMGKDGVKTLWCRNLACKAALSSDDGFCKRCSCYVCHRYDDNKDPSLWLICESDLSDGKDSCGISCHLKCAYKHERSGISKKSKHGKLDGRFYCVSCGKVNDLMSTWRKQLLAVKDARRVDVLCLRISWCLKILDGTEMYRDLHKCIDTAAKKLKKELGPLDRVCERMGRCIVNRLGCGAEVQKLCSSALETFDVLFPQSYTAKHRSLNDIKDTHIVRSGSIPSRPIKVDGRHDFVGLRNGREVESNSRYEYCVRVIKSLEGDGHLSVDFRVKFLTWFSLKASMQERRVVSAFVETMGDEPPSLAEQLIDAFGDEICRERSEWSAFL